MDENTLKDLEDYFFKRYANENSSDKYSEYWERRIWFLERKLIKANQIADATRVLLMHCEEKLLHPQQN